VAGSYAEGARVNLERALEMGSRLDGHLVQGHVDGVGHLVRAVRDGEYWLMDFEVPDAVSAQTIEHGSITLNGVSLTVSELLPGDVCRIGVIPFTHAHTNLGDLVEGAPVNVEGDLIGKYVGRMLAQRGDK
jgi:riboflavin synthase